MKIAFRLDLAHGRCVGVEIPSEPEPANVPDGLHPEERAFARSLSPTRRPTWIGGRQALRAALDDLGIAAPGPLLVSERGAPLLPAGATGSISHKRAIAVGLARARPDRAAEVGVDVELDAPLRADIARRVLTGAELAALEGLSPDDRRRAVLLRLSVKEAVYKALDPFVRRHVSFQEVALDVRVDGTAGVTLTLAGQEGPFAVEARWMVLQDLLLTTASVNCEPRG